MPRYRILSLDGGGIRGILTARLLDRIVAQIPDFLGRVHLYAGTSTGSLLAVGLAQGRTPAEMVRHYQEQGPLVFKDDLFHEMGGLWGLHGAKYRTENRYAAVHSVLGDGTLGDLPVKLLVATFQLDSGNPLSPNPDPPQRWKSKFFHNFPGPDADAAQKAIDVVMRSSAAPTYFPIYQGFVDGGVVANNPSMCALAQAVSAENGPGQAMGDVVLLSLGTGAKPEYLASRDGDWGIQQWGFNLVDLIFGSGVGLADYQCRQFLGDRYQRLDPDLPQNIGLDAVGAMDTLLALADAADLASVLDWVRRQWEAD